MFTFVSFLYGIEMNEKHLWDILVKQDIAAKMLF